MTTRGEWLRFAELLAGVERQAACVVQFHDLSGVTLLVPALKLPARWHYHHGPYCEFMKRQGCQGFCAAVKARSIQIARRRRRPFCGICPQGIWDLVYPVEIAGELVGVFYIGSLAARPPAAVKGQAYAGPALPSWQPGTRARLEPWAAMLARVMALVVAEWRASGGAWRQTKTPEVINTAVREYLAANYHENIALAGLARQLNMHPNYLGQLIQEHCGGTFRQLLTAYRVEKAKVLLCDGNHTVTAAAYGSGFVDSNYFATVFRRVVGQSPRAYARGRVDKKSVARGRRQRGE